LERLQAREAAALSSPKTARKVLERTVFSYAQWLGRHEPPSVKQIERSVKTLQM
jgi:hypothetical protein